MASDGPGGADTATGGVFAPNGRGVREGNGYRVTGRWQWGSGTQHCEWIVGGAILGTLWWLLRGILVFVVIGALIWVYFRLKAAD